MKNCVGQVVRGDDFWNRVHELAAIWDAVLNGSHVLLVAPRRVGKTSIMRHMQDSPKDGYLVVYIDTESADSENEFWHKLFNALMEEEFIGRVKKYTKKFGHLLEEINIKNISTKGVTFGDDTRVDYATAFEKLIIGLDNEVKLIIMIDEFAQTVENIIKYGDEKSAESFLRTHRALRQNTTLSKQVTFMYAGSIGLESVVAKMGATKLINDLNSIKVKPLSSADAMKFTKRLAKSVSIDISGEVIKELLEEIEWFIPFYIQLLIQELKTLSREQGTQTIESEMIEEAMEMAISHQNLFANWRSKLKDGFKKKGYLYAKEILNKISEEDIFSSLQMQNIASKHELDEDYAKEIIHSLEYDGYINNSDDAKVYRFNSPLLKRWWYKNVAN